jgi:hypothetical protein
MQSRTRSRVGRTISWLRETWAEMEYAQRRLIELTVVVPTQPIFPEPSGIDKLEAIYSLPAREPDDRLE